MNRHAILEPSVGVESPRRDSYLLVPTSAGNCWVTHHVQKGLKSRSRVFGHRLGELSARNDFQNTSCCCEGNSGVYVQYGLS